MVSIEFSGDITYRQYANYARELSNIPVSEVPMVYFADATKIRSVVDMSMDQFTAHSEQIIARMVHGKDTAMTLILAPNAVSLPFAEMYREVADGAFPVEVHNTVDRAIKRLNSVLHLPHSKRVALV